jgi:PAS domain S-box-containing protein
MVLKPTKLRVVTWLLAFTWTGLLLGSFLAGKSQQEEHTLQLAAAQAEAHFALDLNIRKWAADHGGVYVPISARTQPNPHLAKVPDRDISHPSGKTLTLMNPAYVIRQLNEDMALWSGARAKITSLNPIRKENGPDPWEESALRQLESGSPAVQEVIKENEKEYLRLMRPLIAEKACLKCHGDQGYREGDLRGGVAVTSPLGMLGAMSREEVFRQLGNHLVFWALGMAGLFWGTWAMNRSMAEQRKLAEKNRQALADTEAILDMVPVGIIIVGQDRRVRRANRTALKILGQEEGDVVGCVCHQNICPSPEGKCPVLDECQTLDNSARKAIGHDGRTVPILKTAIPFTWQGEEVLLEAFIDTTDQEKANNDLLSTVKELQRFNRLAVGRELRMAELKSEVNELLGDLGREPRYRKPEPSLNGGGR